MNSWDKPPTSADWDALVAEVKGATAVLCVAHVSPDGDAVGSAMAAALAMRQVGIEAYVSFDEEPFRLPASLAWLPGQELLRAPSQLPPTIDVVVSFDASDLARLGSLGAVGNAAAMFAAVDHHRSYTGFGTLSLVDVTAPATAVLALELADRLEAELTTDIATCIYAGLTTDTGSFRFSGTTAKTHYLAARLHETGIAHDKIARAVFDTASFSAVKLLGIALERAKLIPAAAGGNGLVWSFLTKADRDDLGLALDSAEPVIDTLRVTAEAEVAVVLKEGDDRVWRASTRSKGLVDLGAVCSRLGGGGHRFAAGFSSNEAPEEIVESIIAAIDVSLKTA